MREIKFRAWDKKHKRWIKPRFKEDGILVGGSGELVALADARPNNQGGYDVQQPYLLRWDEREDVEIMQYTGLKDKNGKKIYEGDIVNCCEEYTQEDLQQMSNGIIEYAGSGFVVDERGYLDEWGEVEIIGNIYENPELCKK